MRYHGVLAPNSPWRVAVVPLPPVGAQCPSAAAPEQAKERALPETEGAQEAALPEAPKRSKRMDWASLLWRVWRVDALRCDGCGGRMKMIAALTERAGIVRILEHLGVSTEVPRMRRARDGP